MRYNRWNVSQLGQASAAVTPTGTVPQYGLAYDLAVSAPWESNAQYSNAVRDFTTMRVSTEMTDEQRAAQRELEAEAARELQLAQSFEAHGYGLSSSQEHLLYNTDRRQNDTSFGGAFGDIVPDIVGFGDLLKAGAKQYVSNVMQDPSSAFALHSPEEPAGSYAEYAATGGLLSEDQFGSFSPETQAYLLNRARSRKDLNGLMMLPGIKQSATGLGDIYRGVQVPFNMIAQARHRNPLANLVDPMWFQPGRYADAWRLSERQSLGNAMVNSVLAPYVPEDQLNEWRKSNPYYQLTSTVGEFGLLWYADPVVLGVKGGMAAGRFARGELPLRETSRQYVATMEALHRTQPEDLTVHGPARLLGQARANRLTARWADLAENARNSSLTDFLDHKMFRERAIEGQAAGSALYWAYNHGSDRLIDMTQQLVLGDPAAVKQFNGLLANDTLPIEINSFSAGAQTFTDAIKAMQTKVGHLERQINDLEKRGEDLTGIHSWLLHSDLEDKQKDLGELTSVLKNYEGYAAWRDNLNRAPEISRVGTGPRYQFFKDNQFGSTHRFVEWTRGAWLQHANAFHIDDLDMGVQSLRRMSEQLWHLTKWDSSGALEEVLHRYTSAATPAERWRIAYDFEREQTSLAIANRLTERFKTKNGLQFDPQTIATMWDLTTRKQNEMIDAVMLGDGVYATGPTVAARVAAGDNAVQLLERNLEKGTARIRLVDGKHLEEIEVPLVALNKKLRPAAPNATVPDTYNPLNIREFWAAMKHHEENVELMQHAGFHSVEAIGVNAMNWIGTWANRLWKPTVLFRFAWPARVLMDENLRALAILGIPSFMRYYGGAYARTGYNAGMKMTAGTARLLWNSDQKLRLASQNAIHMQVFDPAFQQRLNLRDIIPAGPGPVVRKTKQASNPFLRDQTVREAPLIPEEFSPIWDEGRAAKVAQNVAQHDEYTRQLWRYRAYLRTGNARRDQTMADLWGDHGLSAPGTVQRLMENHFHGLDDSMVGEPVPTADHVMAKIEDKWQNDVWKKRDDRGNEVWKLYGEAMSQGPRAYNPVTGNAINRGYAVPLEHTKKYINPSGGYLAQFELRNWYREYRELLSSKGHNVVIDPEGNIAVARVFPQGKRGFKDAERLSVALRNSEIHLLHKRETHKVQDVNDLSPTMQETLRAFHFDGISERVEQPGHAPFDPETPQKFAQYNDLYHGTLNPLPEDLADKYSVSVSSGRLVGSGLYTTMDPHIAEGFTGGGWTAGSHWADNIYKIINSRDGRTYKVFNLDRKISDKNRRELTAYLDGERPADLPANAVQDWELERDIVKRALELDRHLLRRYSTSPHDDPTWMDLFTELETRSPEAQNIVTHYLETQRNAGVLTHEAGHWLSDHRHQVFIWLDPENLLVRPAWIDTGEYLPLVQWLTSGTSVENFLPESKIFRTGIRNPMWRELHTNHAQLVARQEELRAAGKDPHKDARVIELQRHEHDLMNGLGLEYHSSTGDGYLVTRPPGQRRLTAQEIVNAHRDGEETPGVLLPESHINTVRGQDWYVQTDPSKFPELQQAAYAEKRSRDAFDAGQVGGEEYGTNLYAQFDQQLDTTREMIMRAMLRHREGGTRTVVRTTADGKKILTRGAFEGPDGQMLRAYVSSQGAFDALSEGHAGATQWLQKQTKGHKTYHPPELDQQALTPNTLANRKARLYYQQWADLLVTHFYQSPVFNRMMRGWSNDRIVQWLDHSAEGLRVRAQMGEHNVTELWVDQHRDMLNRYLPNYKLQRMLAKSGRLDAARLRREIPLDRRPDIYAPDVEALSMIKGAGRIPRWAIDKVWHGLGTVPVNILSRHPFARAAYDMKMKALIGRTRSEHLTPAMIERMQRQAATYARNQVRKTLWDLSDQTNLADFLRFSAPFWSAQWEAINKWAKIVADRPETVARMFNLQRAVYKNWLVVNEDGQPINDKRGYFDYTPSDRVILSIPPVLRKTPWGRALETVGTVGIPIGSANTVLQGEAPLAPGAGPLLTIPADKFLRITQETMGTQYNGHALYNWLFPIGRPRNGGNGTVLGELATPSGWQGILDQVLPGWGKRVMESANSDSLANLNLYFTVAREMEIQARENGERPPTEAEINRQVKWLQGLRIVTGLVAPVQMEYRPKHQFLIDAASQMRDAYGANWEDHFFEKYGIAARRYVESASSSPISAPPTTRGMEDWSKLKGLMGKYPDWASAMFSPEAYKDEFNPDAYTAQFNIPLKPGSKQTLRAPLDFDERQQASDAAAGWYEYRKMQAIVDAALAKRGLHSIQQVGAEDLAEAKKNFVADLANKLPGWYEEYNNFSNQIDQKVHELSQWAFLPQFDKRPDILGVRQYLIAREQVVAELERYHAATGGSRSLQAAENTDLRNYWDDLVGQLVQDNPAFGEFYHRYLESDLLEQGGSVYFTTEQP